MTKYKKSPDSIEASLKNDFSVLKQPSVSISDAVSTLGTKRIIALVDHGLDDFSATKDGISLSLIMVAKFVAITATLASASDVAFRAHTEEKAHNNLLYKELSQELKDVLYIYNKLKTHPRGLNMNSLNAYDKRYPDAQVRQVLNQMDERLKSKKKKSLTLPHTEKSKT